MGELGRDPGSRIDGDRIGECASEHDHSWLDALSPSGKVVGGQRQSSARVAHDGRSRVRSEFELGADRVILHGATPDELEPILGAYRASQPAPAGRG
jgi:hypothetical protein